MLGAECTTKHSKRSRRARNGFKNITTKALQLSNQSGSIDCCCCAPCTAGLQSCTACALRCELRLQMALLLLGGLSAQSARTHFGALANWKQSCTACGAIWQCCSACDAIWPSCPACFATTSSAEQPASINAAPNSIVRSMERAGAKQYKVKLNKAKQSLMLLPSHGSNFGS